MNDTGEHGNRRLRTGVAAAAGYTAGELLRMLLDHPRLQVVQASSSTYPDRPVWEAHPNLYKRTGLVFCSELDPSDLDAVFLCNPHGQSVAGLPELLSGSPGAKLVDLSGDFRLQDPSLYPKWYGFEHTAPDLLSGFTYGLCELNRDGISHSGRVANPGCFATAVCLALGPLARAGFEGEVSVTAVTGSSGSGATPSATTHHPTRAASLRAYKPLEHQHLPEIHQLLDRLSGRPAVRTSFVPVSGPFVRGIYTVCQFPLTQAWSLDRLNDLYNSVYSDCSFVRMLEAPPDLNVVCGSNFCDLFVSATRGRAVIISALDNLVKGASGQAIQNMNIMMGWEETLGLGFPGLYP